MYASRRKRSRTSSLQRDLVVQDLDRADRAVAVRGHVHGGHAADADQRVEPPLAGEHVAQTPLAIDLKLCLFVQAPRP